MEMEGSNINENTTYVKSNYLFNQHIYIFIYFQIKRSFQYLSLQKEKKENTNMKYRYLFAAIVLWFLLGFSMSNCKMQISNNKQ